MGTAASNTQHASADDQIEYVDGGPIRLQDGVYTTTQDWKKSIVRSLQLARRLAPFYKGLEFYEDSWTSRTLLHYLKAHLPTGPYNKFILEHAYDPESLDAVVSAEHDIVASMPKLAISEAGEIESKADIVFAVSLYKGAIECPICFLFYPRNMATTRCCRQYICTECFVQIRRPNPHPPIVHADEPADTTEQPDTLIMESPVCPYCNVSDFGVIYEGPSTMPSTQAQSHHGIIASKRDIPADHKSVVLTDLIRPDWAAKLQRAKDRAARRAANAALISAHLQRQERRARSHHRDGRQTRSDLQALEEQQIAEAIRLSMLDVESQRPQEDVSGAPAGSIAIQPGSSSQPSYPAHSLPLPELLYAPPADSYSVSKSHLGTDGET